MRIIDLIKKLSFALALVFVAACGTSENDPHAGHDHDVHDEHDHADHDDHDDHGDEKEVHLNPTQFELAGIELGSFEAKNLSEVIHATGYTNLNPQHQAVVSLPISATVKTIQVIEGQYVKKGELLATLHSMEYNNLMLEKSRLQEALGSSEASLEYLQEDYNRQEILAGENVTAAKVFQKIASELKSEEAKQEQLKNQINIIQHTLDQINSKGGTLLQISAPISGYVTHIDIKIGSIVQAGKELFAILDNSEMHMDLLVYEKDLYKVKEGQQARFVLTNQSNQEIKGTIYSIGKAFENETKSVAVHAHIDDSSVDLIPGMYINALIDIGSNEVDALPEEAVIMTEGRKFIYILSDPHAGHDHGEHDHDHEMEEYQFKRMEVITGASQLGYVEVTPVEKLKSGDKIAVKGAYYIQSHLQKSEGAGGHSH